MNSIVHSAVREARLLRQRPWDLAMVSWVPLLGVALLWWIFSAGLAQQLPIGVLDEDHSALSRQITRMLGASPGLRVAAQYTSAAEAEQALRAAQVYGVVALPRGLSRQAKTGQAAQVVLWHNAQLGSHSGMVQRDVRAVVGTLSAGIELAVRHKRGQSATAALARLEPVQTQMVTLFNVSTNYEQFLAAALIPALLHILAMTAGAWSVGRELRDRTLGEWLGARPGWPHTAAALVGKLLWPWLSLSGMGVLALLGITWGRGWQPPGSVAWVALGLLALVAVSIAMGAFMAALTRSLRTALSGAGFFSAPAFAFSGVGFPLSAMSGGARTWALAMPFTHFIALQVGQLQMGAPRATSAPTLAALAGAALLLGALSALLLQRASQQPATWGGR